MPRPIQALIHSAALAHNLARVRRAAPDAKVWAVVKANAYGHGIERVFEALRAADGFALLDLNEAQRLRELAWRGPILLLEGVFEPRDLELCSRLSLWHVVHASHQLDWLAQHKTHQPHRVFLKLNSGMNRLGFGAAALRGAWARLQALPQVEEVTLMTHFSDADGPRGIAHQVQAFEQATQGLDGERSLCNSAATLRFGGHAPAGSFEVGQPVLPPLHSDWVRAGIALYGSAPDFPARDIRHWQLAPAMTLRTHLIAVQQLQAGDTVGYGSRYVASQAMRIGIAACGYADGYPRHAPSDTPVLVDGMRSGLVGQVSMDMLTVDLSNTPRADVGSEVTLWGRGPGHSRLAIDDVAQAAGTLGYELMCALAARVPVALDDSPV